MSAMDERTVGYLVTFSTPTGFWLDGILYGDDRASTTVVHVHGSLGNCYRNRFLRVMGKRYGEAGIRLLSFNLSSHDGLAEGYRNKDEFEYCGGSVVEFDRCLDDIAGAVAFAEESCDRIILQGHSMGCDRVLHYLLSRGGGYDCILLGPCDSYQLQKKWIGPESVEEQTERLKREALGTGELDWLPSREYGIRSGDEDYIIPITRRALLSIMEGPVFRLLRIDHPMDFRLEERAFVYLGGDDALQPAGSEAMFRHLEERVSRVTRCFVSHGGHSLEGCEEIVTNEIIKWTKAEGRKQRHSYCP